MNRAGYGDDETRIRRRLARERFILPEGASFYDLYSRRNEANIGKPHHGAAFFELLDKVMPDWERRKQRLERAMA